ncbi:MAG: SRPBCC family protein [Thermoleophilia bacterium]|nr:SRPBCC family protein [Thermoleophilia bacterium]
MAEHGTVTVELDATPEELFAIVTDLESYPDWVDGIVEVEVLEVADEGLPLSSRMTADVKIRTVSYTLSYEYEYPTVVTWTSEPGGDVKLIEGSYRFEPIDDNTTSVTYELTIDPGFPVPGFMLRSAQKAIIAAALDGLRAQTER